MDDLKNPSDISARPVEVNSPARPSRKTVASILGVFAGSGRGAAIGGVVGTVLCFVAAIGWAISDDSMRNRPQESLGTLLNLWALVILWAFIASLMIGGILGAFLGAMLGALFPIRRGPRGSSDVR